MILNCIFLLASLFYPDADSLVFEKSIGNFQNAASISASREQFLFVSDIRTNIIYKYSPDGKLLGSVGGSGFGQNELNKPNSIDATNGLDVLVCDYQNNRIQRFDIKLNYVSTFDFNNYNFSADNSQKIFYPYSICFLSTSEIFILADATRYKVVKLKSFDEVSLLFGAGNLGYDKLYNPTKIIRGANLDIYILDKYNNDIINFDNYGTYVKKIQNMDTLGICSIAFYGDQIYILKNKYMAVYDLKGKKYSNLYYINQPEEFSFLDLAILNKNSIFILTQKKILNFQIIQ